MELNNLKIKLEKTAGEWNGDESGIQEDRFHITEEALKYINKLEILLKELYD